MKLCLAVIVAVCVLNNHATAKGAAQSAAGVAFEVASVRHVADPAISGLEILPDRLRITNFTLRNIILIAYRLPSIQVIGGPAWINDERYTINAKSVTRATRQEMMQMLRRLLEERVRLKTHVEIRDMDTFALVMAEADHLGPGLHRVMVDCEANRLIPGSETGAFPADARPACGAMQIGMSLRSGPVLRRSKFAAVTMERFGEAMLSSSLGRPVVDRTGLRGTFDIELQYVAESPVPAGLLPGRGRTEEPDGPSLREALQDQLGLRVVSETNPVELLVIDSVERPRAAEN